MTSPPMKQGKKIKKTDLGILAAQPASSSTPGSETVMEKVLRTLSYFPVGTRPCSEKHSSSNSGGQEQITLSYLSSWHVDPPPNPTSPRSAQPAGGSRAGTGRRAGKGEAQEGAQSSSRREEGKTGLWTEVGAEAHTLATRGT